MGTEWRKLGLLGVILADAVGLPLGGYWLGSWAVHKWGLPQALGLLPVGLGLTYAFWDIYRISKREL